MHPWNSGRLVNAARGFAQRWFTRSARRLVAARRIAVVVMCGGLLLSEVAGAEDAGKPRGPSIDEGVREWINQGKPVSGALKLLPQVNTELRAGERTDLLALRSMLFEAACYRASGEELRALGAMIPDLARGADASPHDCDRFKKSVTFYAGAVFRQEVSKLKARPARLALPASPAAPPADLALAPQTLRDAWSARAAAMEPFERLNETVINGPDATKETPEARPDIAALKKLGPVPPRGLWRELIQQLHREELESVAGDATVSRRALQSGIVLSLLADGKMAEAVGAVCSRIFDDEGYPDDPNRQTYAAVTRDFLSAQELDWELIFTGLLLRERPVKPGDLRAFLANTETWLMLGASGSPRGVQTGLDWINHSKMGAEDARPFLIRALGPDPVPAKVLVDSRPKRLRALPREIRAQAITALASYLDPIQPLTPLSRALEDVSPWLAKDLEAPLRKLLTHRSRLIATRALWLLKSAGFVVEETKLPPGSPPIRVRMTVNGAPLTNTTVAVQARGLSQQLTTSAEGELVISLDEVLQREAINAIQLSVGPAPQVTAVSCLPRAIEDLLPPPQPGAEKPAPENAAKPWFHVSVPVNPGEQAPKEVAIETGELEVGLKGSPGIPDNTPLSVMLMRDDLSPRTYTRLPGKPWQSVVFQNVQLGKYRVLVQGEGLAMPQWRDVQVTKRGSLKLVELTPGRTVHATLAGGAPNLRLTSLAKLTRDGVDLRTQLFARGDRWDGLPLGKYKLRIPSSKELDALALQRGLARPVVPQARIPRHAAFEMEFDLTAESPAIVELGVLQLKPEEAGN